MKRRNFVKVISAVLASISLPFIARTEENPGLVWIGEPEIYKWENNRAIGPLTLDINGLGARRILDGPFNRWEDTDYESAFKGTSNYLP